MKNSSPAKEMHRRVHALIRDGKKGRNVSKTHSRSRSILNSVATEIGINIDRVTIAMILGRRCCATSFPKIRYDTMSAARERFNGWVYPCTCCDYWHCTSQKTAPPKPFTCEGCHLTYAKKGGDQRFCSKGCRKQHKRRKK